MQGVAAHVYTTARWRMLALVELRRHHLVGRAECGERRRRDHHLYDHAPHALDRTHISFTALISQLEAAMLQVGMRKKGLSHFLAQFRLELSGVSPGDIEEEAARLRVTAGDGNEELHAV